jgi:NADP-dependent 3-hydroxy acid dehydrogenase YdfG
MSQNAQKKPVIAVARASPGIGEAAARRFVVEGFIAALARMEDKLQAIVQGTETDFEKSATRYYITDLRI